MSRRTMALATSVVLLASVAMAAHSAAAQPASGTVTGRVLWGACIRGIPLPMTPDGQVQPTAPSGTPESAPESQVMPGQRPVPVTGLPAGAVLVALQNTASSARPDRAGRFEL